MNGYTSDGSYYGGGMGGGDQNDGTDGMMMMGQDGMGTPMGGQSLDEIVNQNAKVMRRQSMPLPYSDQQNSMDGTDMRRISMLDYGQSSPTVISNLQYDSSNGIGQSGMMAGGATPSRDHGQHRQERRPSASNLALNTSFSNTSPSYNTMMHSNSAYASPAHPQSGFDMSMDNTYDSSMGMTVDNSMDQNAFGNAGGNDVSQMNMYNQQRFNQAVMSSPMHHAGSTGTPLSARGPSQDPGGGSGMNTVHSNMSGHTDGRHSAVRQLSRTHSLHLPDVASPSHSVGTPLSQAVSAQNASHAHAHSGFPAQPQNPQPGSVDDRGMHNAASAFDGINGPQPVNISGYNPNNQGFNWDQPEGGWPSTMIGRPHTHSVYKNAYSSTGFDMLGVLMRVATRPNPEINIGSVDLSCAFVVCDAEKDDFPIVYCSENFERLTGYTKHMILGRNCRFLQSPDGNVAPGVTRKYVDDNSVLYLKNMITLRREAQISLINYRRGGQPFMNLLTMIPISWNTEQVKFFVGFQVDLVEQPNAVTNKNPDGSYSINYQRGMTMPRYILNPPDNSQKTDLGQTIPREDVSAILTTFGTGESDYAKRMWDKVLLENTDDVVHVLSLKGLFQWISPSAVRVLEYEPSEIIGTALSSVCHPSDIVPVTRELKDTSSGASVNVVFRIRRKNSGFMWFEGHGSLHTEQGKGRKSIILVGRERPVYTLSKNDIVNAGGIGENELWTKMSTSGMFLFVSSNVRQLLDRQPDDLVGVSMQSLMRADSKAEFGRILEHARTGKKASVKHEMINRRGQVLSAFTTLYPGDATEGHKPTFIVAQTRLIKFSRTTPVPRPSIYPKQERHSSEQSIASANLQIGNPNTTIGNSGTATPSSGGGQSASAFINTDGSAVTYAGSNGLAIGRQDVSLASEDNLFDELKTTKSSSWQYEIRQLEKKNRMLVEEVQSLIAAKKKRKRRRGKDLQKDCANCHTRVTPEWRRGPSGQRDLCNSCGLRWAKLNGRVSPRTSSVHSAASDKASKASVASASPRHSVGGGGGVSSSTPKLKAESPNDPHRPAPHGHAAASSGGGNAGSVDSSNGSGGRVAAHHNHNGHHGHQAESHAASMEGASGVPDKIEEGIEPD